MLKYLGRNALAPVIYFEPQLENKVDFWVERGVVGRVDT